MADLKALAAQAQADVNAALTAITRAGSSVTALTGAFAALASPSSSGVPDYVLSKIPNAKLLRAYDFSKLSIGNSISGHDFFQGIPFWTPGPNPASAYSVVNGNLVITSRKDASGWTKPLVSTDDGSGNGFFVPDHAFIEVGFATDVKGGGNFWSMPKAYFTNNAGFYEEDFIEVFGQTGGVQSTMHKDTGHPDDAFNFWDSAVGLGNQSHVWGFYRPGPSEPISIYVDGVQAGTVSRFPGSGGPMGLSLMSEPNYMDGSGDGGLTEVKTTFSLLRAWA